MTKDIDEPSVTAEEEKQTPQEVIIPEDLSEFEFEPYDGPVDEDKLAKKTEHVNNVSNNCSKYGNMLVEQGKGHDKDKIFAISHSLKVKNHGKASKHHWWCYKILDMSLIDVLEGCADIVDAARAHGTPNECEVPLEDKAFSNSVIKAWITNTVHLLNPDMKVTFFKASVYHDSDLNPTTWEQVESEKSEVSEPTTESVQGVEDHENGNLGLQYDLPIVEGDSKQA